MQYIIIMEDFLCSQIQVLKDMITAYNTAITKIITGAVDSYTLDTGQTVTKVTKSNLSEIQRQRRSLMNELSELELRCNGGGVSRVVPGW